MRPKTPGNRDLPPRMLRRVRTRKGGGEWIGYYYDGRDAQGKRKEISLGTDFHEAKQKWAEMERKQIEKPSHLLGAVFDRYEQEIIPAKKPRTQKDNAAELRQLRKVFENAPIDAVTPAHIAQYRDARTAKVRANREIALLSHIYNIAREWGFTDKENPCARVRRNKERPRDFYADSEVWEAVYNCADEELRNAMDLAYLTGQRPADVLEMRFSDIVGSFLMVGQNKTGKHLRICLEEESERNGLGKLIDRLTEERHVKSSYLVHTVKGMQLSYTMLRKRWERARKDAASKADSDLAGRIMAFRFVDIRPKAATDIADLQDASRLLGHSSTSITSRVYVRIAPIVKPTG